MTRWLAQVERCDRRKKKVGCIGFIRYLSCKTIIWFHHWTAHLHSSNVMRNKICNNLKMTIQHIDTNSGDRWHIIFIIQLLFSKWKSWNNCCTHVIIVQTTVTWSIVCDRVLQCAVGPRRCYFQISTHPALFSVHAMWPYHMTRSEQKNKIASLIGLR